VNKKIIYPLILAVVCLLFVISSMAWTEKDGGVTFTADAAHLFNASAHFRNLKAFDIADFMLTREMYPNLVHQLTSCVAFITGDVLKAFALVNLIFVVILAFGVYFTGSHVWNRDTGFFAALLSPALPGIVFYSRVNNIDIATAAAAIWALYFLIRSDRFKNRGMTIAFFALCAVGMLTKWAFVFFLLVPFVIALLPRKNEEDNWNWKGPVIFGAILAVSYALLLVIVNFLGRDELGFPPIDNFWILYIVLSLVGMAVLVALFLFFRSRESRLGNLGMGLVLFMVLTNFYYLFSFQYLLQTYMGRFWGKELQKHASTHNIQTFFIKFFTLDIIGIPVVILAAVGIVYYLVREKKTEGANLLLWSLGSGLVFLALQPLYINRYYLPLAGVMVLFSVFWIFRVPSKVIRAVILVPLITVSVLSWAGWTFLPVAATEIFPEIPIDRPVKRTWSPGDIVKFAAKDFRERCSPGKGGLFIFHNESLLTGIKPLVMMFYFSRGMGADEKIYFFPENINLRDENRGVPLMYYIIADRDDAEKAGDRENDMKPGEDRDEDRGDDRPGNEMDWNNVKPGGIYYIHFVNTGEDGNMVETMNKTRMEDYLKPEWIKGFNEKKLIREFDIPGTVKDSPENESNGIKVLIYRVDII